MPGKMQFRDKGGTEGQRGQISLLSALEAGFVVEGAGPPGTGYGTVGKSSGLSDH